MSDEEKQMESALDLMRRMPPSQTEQNLTFILELVPELTDDLLQTIDQPLKVDKCPKTGKKYLLCDYNRDADSHRSPHSNEYNPSIEDGALPSDKLRKMEIAANAIFDVYRELYFAGGVSSVYFWDLETGFACAVLIQKDVNASRGVEKGSWNSIHVVEVEEKSSSQAHYQLTSTIMLSCLAKTNKMDLAGTLTKQAELDTKVSKRLTHVVNIGKIVQDMENTLRAQMNAIYFGKTQQITSNLRKTMSRDDRDAQNAMTDELNKKFTGEDA